MTKWLKKNYESDLRDVRNFHVGQRPDDRNDFVVVQEYSDQRLRYVHLVYDFA